QRQMPLHRRMYTILVLHCAPSIPPLAMQCVLPAWVLAAAYFVLSGRESREVHERHFLLDHTCHTCHVLTRDERSVLSQLSLSTAHGQLLLVDGLRRLHGLGGPHLLGARGRLGG